MKTVKFTLNNHPVSLEVASDTPLLWVLRDHLGLNAAKYGCGKALCGSCTVHVDGAPVRSCSVPVSAVAGRRVTTLEGLRSREGSALQAAWQKLEVPQCGYCQSGQLMSAEALLKANPRPSDADIDTAMAGNICRCATYTRIRAAIHEAARALA